MINIFAHLLPRARAWRITIDKTLRRFFQGLTGLISDTKLFSDQVYQDLDPYKTRELPAWESQFGLAFTGMSETKRRERLDAKWKAVGGQDPRYIEDTLRAEGFDVYVHEWWEPNPGQPIGGSVNGDVTPVARDPFEYLNDGTTGAQTYLMYDGTPDAQDGDEVAQDGGTGTPLGYPLVNKVIIASEGLISDGSQGMQDGSTQAQDGGSSTVYSLKQYVIPSDPTKYPYFLYIGGLSFPDQAIVPESRRDEFEDLCLKICPTEQWLGILVTYG